MHVYRDRDADQIKLCINLLDRLINDIYHEMIFDPHYEKWGDPEIKTKQLENNPQLYSVEIEHENVKTEKDQEQERKEFKRACEREEMLKQQDIDMLFETMRKYIRGW